MSTGLALQWGVVCVAVAASGAYVVRRQAPRLVDALRRRLAILLLRPSRAPLLRRIGRMLAPAPTVQLPSSGACGDCGERKACGAGGQRPA
jgi:hypothetical protein